MDCTVEYTHSEAGHRYGATSLLCSLGNGVSPHISARSQQQCSVEKEHEDRETEICHLFLPNHLRNFKN